MKKWYNTSWGIILIIAFIFFIACCLIPTGNPKEELNNAKNDLDSSIEELTETIGDI